MRTDPRIRRTLNQFSQNLESANESAQANIFTFSQRYLGPCLASLQQCTQSCTAPCFPDREDRQWRSRGRSRGRAEFGFDFYDDWDEDDEAGDALLGWGNDEMDRLLVGSGAHGSSRDQPGRQRTMSYGTRRDRDGRAHAGRRKTGVQPHDGGPDPTVIPSTSIFGFLEHLPWNLRGKGKRYRPSAADLQDRSAVSLTEGAEGDPLLADSENEAHGAKGKHRRTRSGTNVSEITTDSLSSRGDLFPSEDEDDAVPLDDEFSMALERRTTGSGDDNSNSKVQRKRPRGSRNSTKTTSSNRTAKSKKSSRRSSTSQRSGPERLEAISSSPPSMTDLKAEEERIRTDEEQEVMRRREAAKSLALRRGLSVDGATSPPPSASSRGVITSEDELLSSPVSPPLSTHVASSPPDMEPASPQETSFVPARLPFF